MSGEVDGHLEPALDRDAFACPRCGIRSTQKWFAVRLAPYLSNGGMSKEATQYVRMGKGPMGATTEDDRWQASVCDHCNKATLWHGPDMVWPHASTVGPAPAADMPASVLALYEEGREVAAVSRRAGAALLRAALEVLVKSLVTGGGTLNARIGELQNRVSSGLGMALDVLRDTGNGVLHDDVPDGVALMVISEAAHESEIFDYLCGVVNRLVDEAITQPRQDGELYNMLPPGVRQSVEQRNLKQQQKT